MAGQHVHFIDHVDLEARIRRRIDGLLEQLCHFIDATIRRGIHLDVIDEATGIDRDTSLALAAGLCGDVAAAIGALAVQ